MATSSRALAAEEVDIFALSYTPLQMSIIFAWGASLLFGDELVKRELIRSTAFAGRLRRSHCREKWTLAPQLLAHRVLRFQQTFLFWLCKHLQPLITWRQGLTFNMQNMAFHVFLFVALQIALIAVWRVCIYKSLGRPLCLSLFVSLWLSLTLSWLPTFRKQRGFALGRGETNRSLACL